MVTKYNSVEKDVVRSTWINILSLLIKNRSKVKILEMAGDIQDVWWDTVKPVSKEKLLEIFGITMDRTLNNKNKYTRVYTGRYDTLLKNDNFVKSFPYDFINLDYYGGGRWFSEKYRYDKVPDIFQTIRTNRQIGSFYLALTLDINDKIYPWFKTGKDIIQDLDLRNDVEKFLNVLENPDYWNLWLAIIGNYLTVCKIGKSLGCYCELVSPPYTYIGVSTGHKSRMISYLFHIYQADKKELSETKKNSLELVKKTIFIKWEKNSGKITIKNCC